MRALLLVGLLLILLLITFALTGGLDTIKHHDVYRETYIPDMGYPSQTPVIEEDYIDSAIKQHFSTAERARHHDYTIKRKENGDHTRRLPQNSNAKTNTNYEGLRKPRRVPYDPNSPYQYSDVTQRDSLGPQIIRLQ